MNNLINTFFQKSFSLLILLFFLIPSNIIYSQYYDCEYTSPCGSLTSDYNLSGNKWDKNHIKYYFINGTNDISGDGEKTAFEISFSTWSAVASLSFEETTSASEADIKIHFLTMSEFESTGAYKFDYAATYIVGAGSCGTYIFINDYYTFKLEDGEELDLVAVATHEIGHALGLCHTNNSSTIMYFNYTSKRSLHSYDIQGIRLIYPSISITAKNNFYGGSIYVNNFSTAKTAPYNFTIETGDEVEVSLGAIEQNDGTYDRIWNDNEAPLNLSAWVKETSSGSISDESFSQNYTFDAKQDDNNSTYEAGLRKICNISFSNQFSGASGGQIKVNGVWKNAPTANFPTVEQNLITAEAK